MPRLPETIDAVPVLSTWYGPDSIACHSVRIFDEKEAEAKFLVGQNLCGTLRPPMFDRLTFLNGVFSTRTSLEDAREHFIESVGISVVAGHNILGLVAEGLSLAYGDNQATMYVIGFDFMRFRGMVLPGQEVKFSGEVEKAEKEILATLVMSSQIRPFTRNFLCEAGEPLGEEEKQRLLAQHWIFEAQAQALGIYGLTAVSEGVVPVLMEAGPAIFYKVPVLAGDTITSRLTILAADEQQVFGNVKSYIHDGELEVGETQNLLLQFVKIDEIRKKIEEVRLQ